MIIPGFLVAIRPVYYFSAMFKIKMNRLYPSSVPISNTEVYSDSDKQTYLFIQQELQ